MVDAQGAAIIGRALYFLAGFCQPDWGEHPTGRVSGASGATAA